jgi:hypothetical protein
LDAPAVKGLVIYRARCGSLKFYSAWVESTGTFIGWMKVQPAVEGVDSDCAIGEILGKPIVDRISVVLNRHRAMDRFTKTLENYMRDIECI